MARFGQGSSGERNEVISGKRAARSAMTRVSDDEDMNNSLQQMIA